MPEKEDDPLVKIVERGSVEYFDQLSLAVVASFSSGIVSTTGTLFDLLITVVFVRVGLFIFYRTRTPNLDGEIRLILLSAVGWLIGRSITNGHSWNTEDNLVADLGTRSFHQPKPSKPNIFVNLAFSLFKILF